MSGRLIAADIPGLDSGHRDARERAVELACEHFACRGDVTVGVVEGWIRREALKAVGEPIVGTYVPVDQRMLDYRAFKHLREPKRTHAALRDALERVHRERERRARIWRDMNTRKGS